MKLHVHLFHSTLKFHAGLLLRGNDFELEDFSCISQAERESLRRQVENLSRDLTGTTDTHNKLTIKIHELEKENMIYKNRADEISHKSKVDITNLKMDMVKQRGDLERDRDKLANLVEGLKLIFRFLRMTVNVSFEMTGQD